MYKVQCLTKNKGKNCWCRYYLCN